MSSSLTRSSCPVLRSLTSKLALRNLYSSATARSSPTTTPTSQQQPQQSQQQAPPPVKARIYSVAAPNTSRSRRLATKFATTSPSHTSPSTSASSTSSSASATSATPTATEAPKSWVLNWAQPGEFVSPFKFRTCQDAVTFAAGQGWEYTVVNGPKNECGGCP